MDNLQTLTDTYTLKLILPGRNQALLLRFAQLISHNGFNQLGMVWATFFARAPQGTTKTAVKATQKLSKSELDLARSNQNAPTHPRTVDQCFVSELASKGSIASKPNQITWDLTLAPHSKSPFDLIPLSLSRLGLVKNKFITLSDQMLITGSIKVNDTSYVLDSSNPGMGSINFRSGPTYHHSWVWAQCHLFEDEKGNETDFQFEGLSFKQSMGPLISPNLCSLSFSYLGQRMVFNQLRRIFQTKSKSSDLTWDFEANAGDLSFRCTVNGEHKDFVGVSHEDTDGSFVYCFTSLMSNMTVHVYRAGKLEATYLSKGTTTYESGSRDKNPYVPILI